MLQQISLNFQYPADKYDYQEAWELFVKHSSWYKQENTYIVNPEFDSKGREWYYIYRVIN